MLKHKRVTFSLSEEIINLLNKSASENKKSDFVEKAISDYAGRIQKDALNKRLKEGYLANAEQDIKIAEEFYPLEQEACGKHVLKEEA
ncbi:MAG: hypothetical protein M1536_05150 [Firmicutes bacterium]|nr:hypothetical protein [Bacillota bacterium]